MPKRIAAQQDVLHDLLRHFPRGSVNVFDRDLRYLFAEGEGLAETGLTPELLVGKGLTELLSPAEVARVEPSYRRAFAGEVVTVDLPFRGRVWEIQAAPLGPEGQPSEAIIAVAQDATERRRAEAGLAVLAEAGAVLASSLDVEATLGAIAPLAVPRLADWAAVHLLRADGGVAQVEVAHADPAKVALARELQERYPVDPNAPRGVAHVARTGRSEVYPEVPDELLAAAARDAEHLALLREVGLASALVVPLAGRDRAHGALTLATAESGRRLDAADLALAEELGRRAGLALDNARLYARAQSAEARYRGVFDGTGEAIVVADAAGHYLDANPAAVRLLGYTREELLRLRVGDPAVEGERARAAFRRVLDEGEWRGEVELRRRDGAAVAVEVLARRLDLAEGTAVVAAMRDVTARRAAETLRQEFVDAAAHDLKNPLTAVKATAQLLRRRLRRRAIPDADGLDDGLATIEAVAARATALIEDLTDLARLRGGDALDLALADVDLVALATASVEEIQAGTAAHPMRVEAAEPALVGPWDGRRLRRVLDNLLANAVKYSPCGSEVVVRVWREEDGAAAWGVLAVEDSGIGIPAADLPHVFDRFRRGANVGGIAGTGIGLAGAKQIVEQHGGTIAVESEVGRGSTFTVRLPLVEPASSSPPVVR